MQIIGSYARLAPIELKVSEEMRLRRLNRDALHKPEQQQIVVPLPRNSEPAQFLVDFLQQLLPSAS